MRKFCVRWWVIDPRERYERAIAAAVSEGLRLQLPGMVRLLLRAEDDWFFPTHCEACGSPLMGGATKHALDCPFRKIIEETFPGYQCPS